MDSSIQKLTMPRPPSLYSDLQATGSVAADLPLLNGLPQPSFQNPSFNKCTRQSWWSGSSLWSPPCRHALTTVRGQTLGARGEDCHQGWEVSAWVGMAAGDTHPKGDSSWSEGKMGTHIAATTWAEHWGQQGAQGEVGCASVNLGGVNIMILT